MGFLLLFLSSRWLRPGNLDVISTDGMASIDAILGVVVSDTANLEVAASELVASAGLVPAILPNKAF